MSQPSRRVHLAYLDGIRGLAALYVVMYHLWQFVITQPDIGTAPGWFRITTVFKFGSYAVAVFIVLSGYCLMIPATQSRNAALPHGLRGFMLRRARRILPPYYAALAFSIGLILAIPMLQTPLGSQWDIALPALTGGSLISHLLLFHNWVEQWRWSINPPFWSIALEWQIYFIFALVLLPLWRRASPLIVLGIAFALGLLPIGFGLSFVSTWYIGLFSLGMLGAAINFSRSFESARWVARMPWGRISALLWVVAGAVLLAEKQVPTPTAVADTLVGVATATLLVACTRRLQQHQVLPRGLRLLAGSALTNVGHFSYSLYLIHFPLLAVFSLMLLPLQLGPVGMFAVLVAVGMPAILLIAYGFFYLFERPFLRVPQKQTVKQSFLAPESVQG